MGDAMRAAGRSVSVYHFGREIAGAPVAFILMWVFPREKFRRAPKLELNAALEIGQ